LVDPQWLLELETKMEDDPGGIRARRGVARRARSAEELMLFLDMFALWPGQRDVRERRIGVRPSYNQDIRYG
jgi:hypothetical protein